MTLVFSIALREGVEEGGGGGEVDLGGFLNSQFCPTLYLALKICMSKLSLLDVTIHASLAY